MPERLSYEDDRRILEFGIGMTDLVKRPTRGIDEIERQEFAEGRVLLAQKLEDLRPRVVAFNGKMVYEKFAGRPCKLGLQKEELYGAKVFVLPSTSGLNGGTERAVKTPYFKKPAGRLKSPKELGERAGWEPHSQQPVPWLSKNTPAETRRFRWTRRQI